MDTKRIEAQPKGGQIWGMDRAIIKTRVTALADGIIKYWPEDRRQTAEAIISRYGQPHEARRGYLKWVYNSPWRRTVVYEQGKIHTFPRPHLDVVEQAVGFKVAPEKIKELLEFNSSLLIDGEHDELICVCGSEEMNRIILNLAHEIIVDRKTVAEAQEACFRMAHFIDVGWPENYAHELLFATKDDLVDF